MLKRFILNRWTAILLATVISAALYAAGLAVAGGVLLPVVLSVVIIRSAHKDDKAIGRAYCAGVMIGLAGMAWLWALALLPLLMMYMYGPVQARSLRMAVAMFFGTATPFWLYLPLFLYEAATTRLNV